MAKKWPEIVVKRPFMSQFHFESEYRYRPRFFEHVGHQIIYGSIGNKHFFTKSCHRQTYQNYEQLPQRLQNSDFQSHFSASKINRVFLILFVKNVRLVDQVLQIFFFDNFEF